MDDAQFEVLDELYFVISYDELHSKLSLQDEELRDLLLELAAKEWIRVYESIDEELDNHDIATNFRSYFYLASKKGLQAHNQQ